MMTTWKRSFWWMGLVVALGANVVAASGCPKEDAAADTTGALPSPTNATGGRGTTDARGAIDAGITGTTSVTDGGVAPATGTGPRDAGG